MDRMEVLQLLDEKSSKADAEMALRLIDIIHK